MFVAVTPVTLILPNDVPKTEVSPEFNAVTKASRASAAAALSDPVNAMVSLTLTDDATTESIVTLATTFNSVKMLPSSVAMNCSNHELSGHLIWGLTQTELSMVSAIHLTLVRSVALKAATVA